MSADARGSVSVGASFGYGLLIATLGCAVVAVPAALRAGAALPMGWLALWGAAALMVAPVAGAWRAARPLPPSAWCVPLGFSMSLAPLLVFAGLLKTATHHRPLGGATFAIIAACLVLVAIAVAARVIAWAGRREGALGKAPLVLGALALLAAVPLALPMLGAALRGAALDGLLCLAAASLGALVPEQRALGLLAGRVGPLAWVAVVAVGLGVGLGAAETRAALAEHAPVLLGLAGWLRP